ncbi:MAG: hypothetical protein WCJ97_11495 [Phycisphaerae bacterium]
MNAFFHAARPVWLRGWHEQMNITAGLRRVLDLPAPVRAVLRLTARTAYRAWVDGAFAGCGPARSAHGTARVDEWQLELTAGRHVVAIEINAANIPAYALTDERPFVQAELLVNGAIVAATGSLEAPWEALLPGERVERVQRLSRQRGFAEAWKLTPASRDWRCNTEAPRGRETLEVVAPPELLPRRVGYPRFHCVRPSRFVAGGMVDQAAAPVERSGEAWLCQNSGLELAGFLRADWQVDLSAEAAQWRSRFDAAPVPLDSSAFALGQGRFAIFDFAVNRSGFLRARVRCDQPAVLYITGDEYLSDGDVNCRRLEYFCGVRYELAAGEYDLESFEVFTLRYVKILALTGDVHVENLCLREYARPTACTFTSPDAGLNAIFESGVRTFAQNAVDVFLDCPSRERAGWLCDSFFTARVEPWLTGAISGDALFIENYALCPTLPDYPPGMLPKCYPADGLPRRNSPPGTLANYIPNWPLWLVLQLTEHQTRGGDEALLAAMWPKVQALFAFFQKYLNDDGLLERLDKWVFVDWSDANQYTQAVNYPTNMLYAAALEAACTLYRRPAWGQQAAAIRQTVLAQSYDGRYFVDNAVREGGQLKRTANRTEACQYYAFWFDIASPQSHPALWEELLTQCSADPTVLHSGLNQAGALPAQHLRLMLLARHGQTQRLVNELRAAFLPQAELTGTLWEHTHARNSCNHAFASHVIHLLLAHLLGVRVDRPQRTLTFRPPTDVDLPWCRARLPVSEAEFVTLGWKRQDGKLVTDVEELPAGWRMTT